MEILPSYKNDETVMRQFLDQQAPITFDHGTLQESNREDYETFGCEYQSSLQ